MTHRLESRMREIRQSGSEGGVADNGHPYPYQNFSGVMTISLARSSISPAMK